MVLFFRIQTASPHNHLSREKASGLQTLRYLSSKFLAYVGYHRHFPLDYLLGAWYNKVVIPQTLHQQRREKDEIMSNTKARRNIVFAVVEPNEEP